MTGDSRRWDEEIVRSRRRTVCVPPQLTACTTRGSAGPGPSVDREQGRCCGRVQCVCGFPDRSEGRLSQRRSQCVAPRDMTRAWNGPARHRTPWCGASSRVIETTGRALDALRPGIAPRFLYPDAGGMEHGGSARWASTRSVAGIRSWRTFARSSGLLRGHAGYHLRAQAGDGSLASVPARLPPSPCG
jgi:hypothetical protein